MRQSLTLFEHENLHYIVLSILKKYIWTHTQNSSTNILTASKLEITTTSREYTEAHRLLNI